MIIAVAALNAPSIIDVGVSTTVDAAAAASATSFPP